MPVKLFESIGAGRPVIASSGNAAADFVGENRVGWVVDPDREAVADLLAHLLENPSALSSRRDEVLAVSPVHTWEQRARGVLARLGVPPFAENEPR
jgi:glycosyltransferase involved in cell wall biosynthesis